MCRVCGEKWTHMEDVDSPDGREFCWQETETKGAAQNRQDKPPNPSRQKNDWTQETKLRSKEAKEKGGHKTLKEHESDDELFDTADQQVEKCEV